MGSSTIGSVPPVARFAGFDLDPRARELTRNGRRIRLPGLPFEVLAVLVERPGEVVTREELRRHLWPDGTFVDFDNNLNAAVARLRQTLGDSADNPKFIETLPRVGYRFIAAVDKPDSHGIGQVVAPPVDTSTSTTGPSRRWLWTGALAVSLLATLAGGAAWSWLRRPAQLSRAAQQRGNELTRRGELKAAAQEYQLAVQLDPQNALAYGELAHALNRLRSRSSVATPVGESPSVAAAQRGIEIDDQCALCHGTLGFFLFYHDWQWDAAEAHYQRALQLSPGSHSIRASYAMLLAATGRLHDALEQVDRALQKDPYHVTWRGIRAMILYLDRRYEDSLATANAAVAIAQTDTGGWDWRSAALIQLGRVEEGITALAEVRFAEHTRQLEAAVRQGGANAGLRVLLDVTDNWRDRRDYAWRRAQWRALLGDTDGALEELETAYQLRNVNLPYIATDPVFDNIRDHPRFQGILQGMGVRIGITSKVPPQTDQS